MVGTSWDYMLMLAVLGVFISAAHGTEIRAASRKPEFWTAGAVYLITCGVLDYFAIRLRWWTFNSEKILGVTIATIPVEEFVLFAAIFCLSIGTWTRS